ncbi:DUF1707 domain-containing protein [Amycolatopsis acidiphila]|uniref:DUF1707 domain-containing protein n=1 Tax=Amycolatopsis acidiphila TaxID=715473 RepID=A0A558AJ91_9PSEU|nr:DUF1707 domain-containing protein [Amycolatopsis acidiphila]
MPPLDRTGGFRFLRSGSRRDEDAAGEGQLSLSEVEERLEQVYAARYRHELDALTTDLPSAPEPRTGWAAIVAMAWRHRCRRRYLGVESGRLVTGRAIEATASQAAANAQPPSTSVGQCTPR